MRISDWSSDVCSSDLSPGRAASGWWLVAQGVRSCIRRPWQVLPSALHGHVERPFHAFVGDEAEQHTGRDADCCGREGRKGQHRATLCDDGERERMPQIDRIGGVSDIAEAGHAGKLSTGFDGKHAENEKSRERSRSEERRGGKECDKTCRYR